MIYRPDDRVRVIPHKAKDGRVLGYRVHVWFPFEGWGIVRSEHETQAEAEAAADVQRAIVNTPKENSDGAEQPRS